MITNVPANERLWGVDIFPAGVRFVRFNRDGSVAEIYRMVPLREAAVWFVAISQGYEPPPVLRAFDTPPG